MQHPVFPQITYLNRGLREWQIHGPRNEAHPQIKITVVKNGCGAIETKNRCHLLYRGDVVVTPPLLLHSFTGPGTPVEVLITSFVKLPETWQRKLFPQQSLQFFKLDEAALSTLDFLHMCCEHEHNASNTLSCQSTAALLLSILTILLRSRDRAAQINAEIQLENLNQAIAARLHETVKVQDLARQMGLSESTFRQSYKKQFGLSPKSAITKIRLQHAQNLLAHSNLKVQAIAQACGFSDGYTFSKFFRRHMGVPPARWRTLPPEERWRPRVFDKKKNGLDI